MSCSGKTTWWAPMRSRMVACWRLIALAQMSRISISASSAVVRMLASRSLPMATTTRLKSPMPISASASGSVESATTTWPSCPDSRCTMSGRLSTASTSVLPRASSSARAVPNRPRPMTATGSLWLANDGPLLGELVAAGALAQRQPGRQGERPDTADVHEQHQQRLPGGGDVGGDAGGQADGGEGGDDLEQHLVEGEVAEGLHHERRERDDADGEQGDGQRLALVRGRHPAAADLDVGVAAHLRP